MTAIEPEGEDPAAAFAAVATVLSEASTVEELAGLIVSLALTTIEACDRAGVIARHDDRVVTIAASDELVRELERAQVDSGEGPCLDVLAGRSIQYAADLSNDGRWPRFSAVSMGTGVRSVLAVPIGGDGSVAALSLYASRPDAFGPIDMGQAAIFGTHARLALAERREHNHQEATGTQLRQALMIREVIGQAQGILMERDRISARQAFEVLRQASQHLNLKLRDVAQALVDTGEDPDTGSSAR